MVSSMFCSRTILRMITLQVSCKQEERSSLALEHRKQGKVVFKDPAEALKQPTSTLVST